MGTRACRRQTSETSTGAAMMIQVKALIPSAHQTGNAANRTTSGHVSGRRRPTAATGTGCLEEGAASGSPRAWRPYRGGALTTVAQGYRPCWRLRRQERRGMASALAAAGGHRASPGGGPSFLLAGGEGDPRRRRGRPALPLPMKTQPMTTAPTWSRVRRSSPIILSRVRPVRATRITPSTWPARRRRQRLT